MRFSRKAAVLTLALLGSLAASAWLWLRVSPNAVFLQDEDGARWLRPSEPSWLGARSPGPRTAIFRKRFTVPSTTPVSLALRALKLAQVRLDGRLLYAETDLSAWKTERFVSLGALSPGSYELAIAVYNADGPDALLVRSDFPGLSTDASWQSSRDERAWAGATPASSFAPCALSLDFESPGRSLRRSLPVLGPVFVLVFFWSWAVSTRRAPPWLLRATPTAPGVRFCALAAWVLLVLNDMPKLPLGVGFDVTGHLDYMHYLLTQRALPTASQGWQMFQAPLYYLLSLPFYAASLHLTRPEGAQFLLRIIPLLCGAAQIELSYRAAKLLFPKRGDLHALGAVLGGLMPMNIYLSLGVGNEPLSGALTAATIVYALHVARKDSLRPKESCLLGGLLGLALLAKASAFLLVLPLSLFLISSSRRRGPARLAAAATVLAAAAVVSGWYYARNWLYTGSIAAFSSYGRVGLSSAGASFGWWQDPGYRTASQLLSFGEALRRPVYASLAGFWDSLYSTAWLDGLLSSIAAFESRPPWNYRFMLSLSWLSLFPTACMILGLARSVLSPGERRAFLFLTGCVGIYLAAVLGLWLRFPIYGIAKATYTVGLLPCYAALGCLGLERLARRPAAQAAAYALTACWAVCSVLAFFVLSAPG